MPVEKSNTQKENKEKINPLELKNICFAGTSVESGYGLALVIQTGVNTYFGNIARSIVGQKKETDFDKGIKNFTWLMITFMSLMVPTVFFINGIFKHNWFEAFLFAISIAVGLTPEMLPAIITTNLSIGAVKMSKKK